jgi:hypothetical protein
VCEIYGFLRFATLGWAGEETFRRDRRRRRYFASRPILLVPMPVYAGQGNVSVGQCDWGELFQKALRKLRNMPKEIVRVVTRGTDGKLRVKEYNKPDSLLKMHTQVGIDDCSTDLGIRGLPVFRGLIGPMPEGKNAVRYESPEVFETLTKEWSMTKTTRRRAGVATPPMETLLEPTEPGI